MIRGLSRWTKITFDKHRNTRYIEFETRRYFIAVTLCAMVVLASMRVHDSCHVISKICHVLSVIEDVITLSAALSRLYSETSVTVP